MQTIEVAREKEHRDLRPLRLLFCRSQDGGWPEGQSHAVKDGERVSDTVFWASS
jgi:hypothetical protein